MPKSPRKNPTPRKLLRLSSPCDLQQSDNAYAKELTELTSDSFHTATVDDSEPKHAANDSGCLEFDRHGAAAVPHIKSTTQDTTVGGKSHRSTKGTELAEESDNTGSTKTSSEIAKGGDRSSKRSEKNINNRSTEVSAEISTLSLLTSKPSFVDDGVQLQSAHIRDKHEGEADACIDVNNDSVSVCKEDIDMHNLTVPSSDIMLLASTACATSSSADAVEDKGSVATGQLAGPDDVDVSMPTPQKNQLRSLSEELFSLNQESTHITTHIHRRSGTTPRRGQNYASGGRRSLSTPRRFSSLNSDSRSSGCPRSTPRRVGGGQKTPLKVKFPFSTTPSKSEKEVTKMPSSKKKKSPGSFSVLKFPTPSKKNTKRKLYVESPEYDAKKPNKMIRYVFLIYVTITSD